MVTHPQGCSVLADPVDMRRAGRVRKLLLFLAFVASPMLHAQSDSLLGVTLVQNKTGASLGVPMQIVLLMTALTVLPAVLMTVTPFLRIVVVLHFLRQALGTQATPSNQVLVGLALFLALLVVQPVAEYVYQESWQPLESGKHHRDRCLGPGVDAHQDVSAQIRA